MQQISSATFSSDYKAPLRVGYIASISLMVITLLTCLFAIRAVPISGAYAPGGGIAYPYLDTIRRYPRDYLWQHVALMLVMNYVILWVAIHAAVPAEKQVFSQISLVCAMMAGTVLLWDYYVQMVVVPNSLRNQETDGISMLIQYNPHGIFIALEELGYSIMSVSFLFLVPIFGNTSKLEKAIKWIFLLAFLAVFGAFVVLTLQYGIDRKDRYALIVLLTNWLVLLVNGVLLSIVFRNMLKNKLAND